MKFLSQRVLLFWVILFLCFSAQAQDKFVFSGYVKDQNNGEELIGATVMVKELASGVVTNPYGFFSITLPKGEYQIAVTYVGFEEMMFSLDLSQNVSQNFELVTGIHRNRRGG